MNGKMSRLDEDEELGGMVSSYISLTLINTCYNY